MHIQLLPSDVLIIVMQHLSSEDLAALARACRFFHALVYEFGWKGHLRLNDRQSYSLHKSFLSWNSHVQVRYHALTDQHWSKAEFVARPLSHKWTGTLQPLLAINSSRLFVAAGNTIYSYVFSEYTKPGYAPGVQFESSYSTTSHLQASQDITSLTSVEDGGKDRTLFVGYADGTLECVRLPGCEAGSEGSVFDRAHRERWHFFGSDLVESLASAGRHLVSLSSSGTAVFLDLSSPSSTPQYISLEARSWCTHLSTRASTPYVAFGTSSMTPLAVHPIDTSTLHLHPSAILTSSEPQSANEPTWRPSAVYGIAGAPPGSPWGGSDQILISGWYDGLVRVHDLRSSSRTHAYPHAGGPAPLRPVLSMYDPWTFEPIYAVACGGGSTSHIAAGTARHSVVALWDVRAPDSGWSVHAPGNDSSPVYSLVVDSSRVFGATQSRPFVLDFGPDVGVDTYPPLLRTQGEGLKRRDKSGHGFYVTKYNHRRP
ncbi:hypothetical protein B0H21DRAFT_555617 [Amylocystis lapponica]|nr:hypothetical protein B0H21DRAFT_555617 [Amylocystis lapponica]